MDSKNSRSIPKEKWDHGNPASGEADQNSEVQRIAMDYFSSPEKSLEDLPDELKMMIFQRLDLTSIAKLRSCSQAWSQFGNDRPMWKSIGKQIGCQVTDDSLICDQVRAFIAKLLKEASNIPKRPQEIDLILVDNSALSIEQINHLQSWLKAYNTLVVWEKLVTTMNPNITFEEILGVSWENFQTAEVYIEKAKEFDPWLVANQNELGRLTHLYLSNLNLTSLPKEVCYYLTGLEYLDLSGNQLSSLPEEIGFLLALETLDLISNQLSSLPEEIGLLLALEKLDLSDNPLNSIPAALDQLAHLKQVVLLPQQYRIVPNSVYLGMPVWKFDLVHDRKYYVDNTIKLNLSNIELNPNNLDWSLIEDCPLDEPRQLNTIGQLVLAGAAAAVFFIGRYLFL